MTQISPCQYVWAGYDMRNSHPPFQYHTLHWIIMGTGGLISLSASPYYFFKSYQSLVQFNVNSSTTRYCFVQFVFPRKKSSETQKNTKNTTSYTWFSVLTYFYLKHVQIVKNLECLPYYTPLLILKGKHLQLLHLFK